jgi:hypothetical protein
LLVEENKSRKILEDACAEVQNLRFNNSMSH